MYVPDYQNQRINKMFLILYNESLEKNGNLNLQQQQKYPSNI